VINRAAQSKGGFEVNATIIYPMPITVSPAQAMMWIDQIPHSNCRKAAKTCWSVDTNGEAPEKSVNWLFCWAMTGQGSIAARDESRRVFDRIFSIAFETYRSAVPHEHARSHRY
jgi:hypothetical protein